MSITRKSFMADAPLIPRAENEDNAAIILENISVRYWLRNNLYRPSLLEFLKSRVLGQSMYRDFWALQNVSLTIRRGEVFGIVGPNGSGKSTLLKVVARILPPAVGRVRVRGQVSALIELGAGFQPLLTGLENIRLKFAMMGRPNPPQSTIDDIVDFSGLKDFIDSPVYTYSSGMNARLAFAVATDTQPDVLIVDEVLAVGDAEFRERSKARIDELCKGGATVLLVSHSPDMVKEMCDRAAWLSYGRLQMIGAVLPVVNAYQGITLESWDAETNSQSSQGTASGAAPQKLLPTETLFHLQPPGTTPAGFTRLLESYFEPSLISPIHSPAQRPQEKPGQVFNNMMLVHGDFTIAQITRIIKKNPVSMLLLREPKARAISALLALTAPATDPGSEPEIKTEQKGGALTIESDPALVSERLAVILTQPNRRAALCDTLVRTLGLRLQPDRSPFNSTWSLQTPLSQVEYERAVNILESMAFFGLSDRPVESYLLMLHTFGWQPPVELPEIEALPDYPRLAELDPLVLAELSAANSADADLYRHAVNLFESRYAAMLSAISTVINLNQANEVSAQNAPETEPGEVLARLRRYYQQNLARSFENRDALFFRFDRPMPGTGWYAVEFHPQLGPYRWMGPDPQATLKLTNLESLEQGVPELLFRCQLHAGVTPAVLSTFKVSVNQFVVPIRQEISFDGTISCFGKLPGDVISGQDMVQIHFSVDHTEPPRQTPNGQIDMRKLGVSISWMEIRPLVGEVKKPAAEKKNEPGVP